MENKVKVSIVIPIYNVEKYLEECVRSAMNQSLKEIEIICVNDGSTDNSLNILKKLQREDPRIVIVDKPNGGYGHSLNKGFERATGEYMAILESDDYIHPDMYKNLYSCIKKHNVDFIKSNFYYLYGSGKDKLIVESLIEENDDFYNKVFCPRDKQEIFVKKTTTWTGLYNLDFLRKHNIRHNETPGASYQDTGFCFAAYSLAKNCIFVKDSYYYYRQDNPNASMKSKGKVNLIVTEYDYIRKNLEEKGLFETYKGLYTYKKYDAYFNFNYNRISHEFKQDFLKVMSNEFSQAVKNGEYNESYFADEEKRTFMSIAENPQLFYTENLMWRCKEHTFQLNNIKSENARIVNSKKYKLGKLFNHFIRIK